MTVQRDSQCDLELSTNLHKSIYMQVFYRDNSLSLSVNIS